MIDLLAVAERAQRGDLRCVECGVNLVVVDPFEDRLRLMETKLYRSEAGEIYAHCAEHGSR